MFVDIFCCWHLHRLDWLTGSLFDHAQHTTFTWRNKQDCITSTTSTASTTDTVYIRLCIVRNIVVHNVGDTFYVQTTSRNVSCDQNINLACFQFFYSAFTQFLRNITVQRFTRVTASRQFTGQLFCSSFSTHEYQQAIILFNFQHTGHRVQLMQARN